MKKSSLENIKNQNVSLISVVIFCLALILQIVAYQNIEAPFVAIIFLLLGYFIFHQTSFLGGGYEIKAFLLFFSICYFWAGVAGIYAVYWEDFSQKGDSSWFFELATNAEDGYTLDELRGLTSGSGVVYMWRAIYRLFSLIGFEKGTYIGIAFNTFLVSITGVISIKTVRLIFGDDQQRLVRFTYLFAVCGVFWLFAATFLRDSSVLLLNTLLVYIWVNYLVKPEWIKAVLLVVSSIVSTVIFAYLRTEFFFVPVAMLLAGVGSFFVSGRSLRLLGKMSVLLMICVLCGVGWFIMSSSITDYVSLVASGSEQYGEFAKGLDNNGSSLGVAYVLNQPMPVRLAIGSFYLQVFPIPIWAGFFEGSIYHLLKSFNAIFMWFVMPLSLLGVYRSQQVNAQSRKVALLFLAFVYTGFTVAIAGTSLETRHLGSFLVPLLIVATVPDLRFRSEILIYRKLLGAWLGLIIFIHIIWTILKIV